jgi:hypothetical protein
VKITPTASLDEPRSVAQRTEGVLPATTRGKRPSPTAPQSPLSQTYLVDSPAIVYRTRQAMRMLPAAQTARKITVRPRGFSLLEECLKIVLRRIAWRKVRDGRLPSESLQRSPVLNYRRFRSCIDSSDGRLRA